jgi:hypothetical protein
MSFSVNDLHAVSLPGKVSPAMSAHLAGSNPGQKVHAIVVLRTPATVNSRGKRQTPQERQTAIRTIRDSASSALDRIDSILKRFGGRRLSQSPSALGTIAVEITPAGISALSESDDVRAILENQPLSSVS